MMPKRNLTKLSLAGLAATIIFVRAGARAQTSKVESGASQTVTAASGERVSPYEGQNVVEVRVINDAGDVVSKSLPALPMLPGHPYDSEAVRISLRNLYATGDYSDMRAEVTNVPSGLRVDFVVQRNYFIGVVRVDGLAEPPSDSAAYS